MNDFYEIKSCEKRGVETEVLFDIATARSSGLSLVSLKVTKKEKSNALKNVLLALKDAKKRSIIDFYVPDFEIAEMGPAASYLLNKFPELANREEDTEFYSVYVRI